MLTFYNMGLNVIRMKGWASYGNRPTSKKISIVQIFRSNLAMVVNGLVCSNLSTIGVNVMGMKGLTMYRETGPHLKK